MNILLGKVYEEDDNDGGVDEGNADADDNGNDDADEGNADADEGNAAAKNNGNDDELKVTASHLSLGCH